MHVALYSPAWPPGTYPNGIVTYVKWMREELMAQGHRVSILSGTIDPAQTDVRVYRVEQSLSERLIGAMASRFLGKANSVFDLGETIASTIRKIHAHDPIDVFEMEESFGWAAAVHRATDVPVVVKLHGPAFLHLVEEELRTAFGKEKVLREGEALASLPFITSPSLCHLADTLSHYDLRPAIGEHVVNPAGLDQGMPLWELERCDRNTLLFVGRFDKVKGGDLVLRAFQRLLQEKPDLRLIFVGPDYGFVRADGTKIYLKEFVASLEDPAVANGLSYKGRLNPIEIAVLRTTALCTFVASRRESQGYTALEAMLQGCPVVCADNSGLSEIVEHGVTGLKARSESAEDLAAQLKRIVDEPELGRLLGSAARQYVLTNHSPARVVNKTLDVYKRAVALHVRNAFVHC